MPFEIGELNEWYANIERVGVENSLDLYEFSRPVSGSFHIGVQPLSAPVSVELLDEFGNVLSAVNASESDGGSLEVNEKPGFCDNLCLSTEILHRNPVSDYLLKISSIEGETPYLLSISPDGKIDPITNWGITEGFFVADTTGEVGVDYLLDGGSYQGELAIFSLKGMENLSLGSSEFITEAARRALSNSTLGHVVISDSSEGAKFSIFSIGNNSGEYLGPETFSMSPGDVFAAMLVPNGTVQEVYDNPLIGGNKRPLFSLATANPSDAFHVGQVGDITGSGSAFAIEDLRVDTGTDRDYNDIIWQFSGAIGLATPVGELIAPEKDWRSSEVGIELLEAIAMVTDVEPEPIVEPSAPDASTEPEPIVEPSAPVEPVEPEPIVEPSAPVESVEPEPIVEPSAPVEPVEPEPIVEPSDASTEPEPIVEPSAPVESVEPEPVVEPPNASTEPEPIVEPSASVEPEPGQTTVHPSPAEDSISVLPAEPLPTNPEQFETGIGLEIMPTSDENPATAVVRTPKEFTSGVFTVGETGEVGIDFLFDGGKYQGEVAIFSLSGLDEFELGSPEFISEVARRALSNSAQGYVAISDRAEGALYSGLLGESKSWNEGEYESKTFAMNPSDRFGIMLVPNGTVAEVAENPTLAGAKRPLFSMAVDEMVDDKFHGQQLADVTGDGVLFAWEDLRLESWSDRDYNDILFSIKGATGSATDFDAASDPEKDWRNSDLGREIIQSVLSPVEKETDPPILTVEKIEAGISGRVEDLSEIFRLRVGFDATPTSEFVSVTASLASDGSFTLDGATLEEILGTSLDQSSHVLYLEATDIHGNIGVTAIRTGVGSAPTNEKELNLAVGSVYGLDPYPDGIALPAGGQRQLSLRLNGWPDAGDVSAADAGTRYFVSHPDIVQVTADGLVKALKEGVTTVTIFYGATSVEIPVGIEAPEIGPAVVGEDGGIVVAADGSQVMLPPGALDSESSVSLTPLEKEDLSLEFPSGFEFAGAFNLEFDAERLDLPAQLAIPAPENIEPGTEVYFMRKGALPDSEGNWNPAWLIEESGSVDPDGTIRTTSPPFPGIIRPGEYMVAYSGQTGSATVVQGQLTVSYAFPPAFYGFILPSALPGTSGDNLVGMLIDVTAGQGNFNDPSAERRGDWGSLIDGPYYTIPAVTISYDISSLKTFAVPSVGLPIITDTGVQRNAEGIAQIDARLDIPAPIESDPLTPPILQEISLRNQDEAGTALPEPVLFLTGSNILVDESELGDPLGSRFEDLTVEFYVGERVYSGTVLRSLSEELGDNQYKVAVSVPDTVALGSSRVTLTRRQNQVVGQVGTEPVYEEIELSGNSIRLSEGNEYVFAALQRSDQVAVLDGSDPESTVENSNSADILLSRIPVGTGSELDRPRDLATTSDGTRVYVVLERSGQVALVDPLMLRQVDTQALVEGMNPISLPEGAAPKALAIDSRDNYAYITDGNRGEIYVLDLNPASDAFHEVVATLSPTPELSGGFKQLAISSDDRKLFATGSDNYIYAFNIDPNSRPLGPTDRSGKWRSQIGRIQSATGADAIRATADPNKMTFVNGNRNQDGSGFGVIEITNDDPENFAATVTYENLTLEPFFDYFDVNEGVSVAITRDSSYAFVAGRNWRGNISQSDRRSGGNIGIIKDPLGPDPELIAATRPIPGALTASVELSNDNKYLYASYPTLNGSGNVFVFDIEEMARTLENPGQFQIDHLARGVGSPEFDTSTARSVTAADFETVPIDDINPEISIAADYEIIQGDWARQQFTLGVPDDSTRGPVGTGTAIALAASPPELVELIGPIGSSQPDDEPTTPTFSWEFDIPSAEVSKVNLFVSTFPEGSGLLPWDPVINLSEVLPDSNLSEEQKQELLSSRRSGINDFNPNRILTASWTEDDGWKWNGGENYTSDNTSFTLESGRTLTAGQTYYWALEVFDDKGVRDLKRGQFDTPPVTNDSPFTSVTVLTHGAVPPINSQSGIPRRLFDLAGDMVNAGGGGLILRYDRSTGNWIPVNRNGGVLTDFPPGQDPSAVDNYLDRLSEYINNYRGQPLVLIPDWAEDFESIVPDSGFTEAAADTFYASLVGLDQALGGTVGERDALGNLVRLYDSAGQLIRTPGALFNSPTHLIGFSRGTVVNSELAQRLLTTFPTIGGTDDENRDFQMTTLDPHDFDQEGLSWPILGGFRNFYEPKIQIWDGITWADNYYQTTADPSRPDSLTPNGRNIPYLLPPEDTSDAPGLQFPKDENDNFLGVPDLVEFLGTRAGETGYADSRAGFSRQTDPILGVGGGLGATHGRVLTWYDGSANLELSSIHPRQAVNWSDDPRYRRRSDGHYEVLFDEDFYDAYPNRVNPWYVPKHAGANFNNIPEQAPWEGIGTGWFYSVLGGGIQERPYDANGVSRDEIGNFEEFLSEKRIPLHFDNTHSASMRGDAAIPTLFNGNFDAALDPFGTSLSLIRRNFSNGLPGWSFHNGENPQIDLVSHLEDMRFLKGKTETDYALKLGDGLTDIVHNRFVVPDWGALRFDLHVPVPATLGDRSDYLEVYLETDTDTYNLKSQEINLPPDKLPPIPPGEEANPTRPAVDLREVHPSSFSTPTLGTSVDPEWIQLQLNRVGFGSQGFETFQVDVPDEARGKAAKLRFKLHGDTIAYIDDIFFQSEHLKFGNPALNEQEARKDETVSQPDNYLLEQPQFVASYNESFKTPNWVSYQLNSSWTNGPNGSIRRGESGAGFVENFSLPSPPLTRVSGSLDYDRFQRGHMTRAEDRARLLESYHPDSQTGDRYRIYKDYKLTYLMSNILPQFIVTRGRDPWGGLETYLTETLVEQENKELYLTAGRDGERSTFNSGGIDISVPEHTWKVVLQLEPGQGVADVTRDTIAFAVDIPNYSADERANPGDPESPLWSRNWRDYVVSINDLEAITGYDFLSNIPIDIQEWIEGNDDPDNPRTA